MFLFKNKKEQEIVISYIHVFYDANDRDKNFSTASCKDMELLCGLAKSKEVLYEIENLISNSDNIGSNIVDYYVFISDSFLLSSFSPNFLFYQARKRIAELNKKKENLKFAVKYKNFSFDYYDDILIAYYENSSDEAENDKTLLVYNDHVIVYEGSKEIYYRDIGERNVVLMENVNEDE